MHDDVESIREEYRANKKELRDLWEELARQQSLHLSCEQRCSELSIELGEVRHSVNHFKDLIARWQAHTGEKMPPLIVGQ